MADDADRPAAAAAVRTLPVIEETLETGKRVVDRGGWRISKHVTTRDEVVDEPLVHQRVEIERRPVGRLLPTLEHPGTRQDGDTLVIAVVEEVLVTEKRLLLKEEIRIRRVSATVHDPTTFTLRSEEMSVERIEP